MADIAAAAASAAHRIAHGACTAALLAAGGLGKGAPGFVPPAAKSQESGVPFRRGEQAQNQIRQGRTQLGAQ